MTAVANPGSKLSKTIVILGGAGFVGTNLALAALARGHRVLACDRADRFGTFHLAVESRFPAVRLISVDLAAGVPELPDDADIVINLAALPHVEFSMYAPALAVNNNVALHVNALEAARRHSIPFLFVSSIEVYGGNDGDILDEDCLPRPLSPYAASKVACEQILHSYAAAFAMRAAIVRLTNLYGPWQTPDRLVPRFIARFLSGADCDVDAMRLRDFLHVRDAVSAILAVAEAQAWGETFNIASGVPTTTQRVASLVAANCDGGTRLRIAANRDFDGRGYSLVSSGARLTARTGWSPLMDVEKGLRETCAWYRAHEEWWRQFTPAFMAERTSPDYIVDYRTWPGAQQGPGDA